MRIGLIPARGGSKRVMFKNTRELNGHPLIAWTINDLKNSEMIDDVYVTTDNEEIAEIAKEYGSKIIMRPDGISDDYAQLEPAIKHAISVIDEDIDIIGIFQPTTPFRNIEMIDEGIKKMINTNADSLIYVCEFDRFIWSIDKKPINYDYKDRIRSQDKEWELVECGDYLSRPLTLDMYNNRIGGHIEFQITDKLSYFDIDTELDLKIANGIAKQLGLHVLN